MAREDSLTLKEQDRVSRLGYRDIFHRVFGKKW